MITGPVLLATRSEGKLRELRPLFAASGLDARDLLECGIAEHEGERSLECFDSFEANARAKAQYFFERSSIPTFADDSGLEVLALGGKPGVLSKRWSGHENLDGEALDAANNAHLLTALRDVDDRRARYVCVAWFYDGVQDTGRRGEVDGWISHVVCGTGGFGYDPYFVSVELGRSFGELTRLEKEHVSHRGRAFRALLAALAAS